MPNSGLENLTLANGSARMNLALPTRHEKAITPNARRQTPNLPLQQVPLLLALRFQVFSIMGICRSFDRDLFDNFQTIAFKADNFLRVIRQEPDLFDSQVYENLCSEAVFTQIARIAELLVCFHRIQAILLKLVSVNLGG